MNGISESYFETLEPAIQRFRAFGIALVKLETDPFVAASQHIIGRKSFRRKVLFQRGKGLICIFKTALTICHKLDILYS